MMKISIGSILFAALVPLSAAIAQDPSAVADTDAQALPTEYDTMTNNVKELFSESKTRNLDGKKKEKKERMMERYQSRSNRVL